MNYTPIYNKEENPKIVGYIDMACNNCRPTVQFKKLSESALIPTYAHPGDSGMDLYADEERIIKAGQKALISTGLAMALPEGYEGQVRPRSGLANKNSLTVLNSPGTIDTGFRGEIKILMVNFSEIDFMIYKGIRIAQLIIAPVKQANIEVVEELPDSIRGDKGWGSTGI